MKVQISHNIIILTETTATFIHSVPRSIDITATADTELIIHRTPNNVTKEAHKAEFLECRTII